jgi:hemerythrin
MEAVEWNESYSVGHEALNEEHRILLAKRRDLQELLLGGAGRDRERLRWALADLTRYSRRHMQNEESVLEMCGYPALAAHRKAHHEILARMESLQQRLETGYAVITYDLQEIANEWLEHHYKEMDRHYIPHVMRMDAIPGQAVLSGRASRVELSSTGC